MERYIHWWIYSGGLAFSILFIGLSFINKLPLGWQNVFCGIGASGIGAVFLSFALEWANETRRIKQNKLIFQTSNSDIFSSICSLLRVVNRIITTINHSMGIDNCKIENVNVEELVKMFCDAIKKIENMTIPILSNSEIVSTKEMEYMRTQRHCGELLSSHNEEIEKFRQNFDSLKEKFDTTKSILLTNSICDLRQVNYLQAVLEILSSQNRSSKKFALIEIGNSLKELRTCGLIPTINDIGFSRILFNTKNSVLETSLVENR